jgi:hypothetical protein
MAREWEDNTDPRSHPANTCLWVPDVFATHRRLILLAGILAVLPLLLAFDAAAGQKADTTPKTGPPKSDRPPAIEQITEHTYRIGAALVDTNDRTVICPGEINMDDGAIEYLAVSPGGKTHESLLRIDIRPLHLQLALLMLDLEPKNVLVQQGDKKTPQGDPVELRIRWKSRDGQVRNLRAEELVSDGTPEKPMPRHDWVFTGSRVLKQGFQADLEKSLVAVWHDPAAILDNPLPGGGNNAYLVNPKITPKRGTHVELIIRAIAPVVKHGENAGGQP